MRRAALGLPTNAHLLTVVSAAPALADPPPPAALDGNRPR